MIQNNLDILIEETEHCMISKYSGGTEYWKNSEQEDTISIQTLTTPTAHPKYHIFFHKKLECTKRKRKKKENSLRAGGREISYHI